MRVRSLSARSFKVRHDMRLPRNGRNDGVECVPDVESKISGLSTEVEDM